MKKIEDSLFIIKCKDMVLFRVITMHVYASSAEEAVEKIKIEAPHLLILSTEHEKI